MYWAPWSTIESKLRHAQSCWYRPVVYCRCHLDCWSYSGHSDRVPAVQSDQLRRWTVCFDELVMIVRDCVPGVPLDILDHWTDRCWTVWRNWTVCSSRSRREHSRVPFRGSSTSDKLIPETANRITVITGRVCILFFRGTGIYRCRYSPNCLARRFSA